jgi:hypothetical protein
MHLNAAIRTGNVSGLFFFAWTAIEDNPNFHISRIGKYLYSFDEASLRRFLPPPGAVTPNENTGVQNVETVNNEEGRKGQSVH